MIWALWHAALSCWKYIRRWYTVVIKGWTWSATILREAVVLKRCSIGTKGPKCAKKIFPKHYTTSTSLNRWDKAGWSMLSCSLHQILTLHLNVAAEIETHQTRQRFSNLQSSDFGDPVWIVSSVCCSYLTGAAPVWSSAAGAHLFQGSRCCVFRDGILQILVVTSGYLSYCCLSIISNQSAHSPLISDINKAFSSTQLLLTGYFLFFGPFSVNTRDSCVWKSQ